jgi:predicted CXXCH cytochrome family protein
MSSGGCPNNIDLYPRLDIGGASDYVGADVCIRCHGDVHAAWADSAHARALDTLRAIGQEYNRECLGCHTTGYREGGFVSAFATPKFGGVQCESCHGPAAIHVGTRSPADILAAPGTNVCARCHTGPEQPNFEEWSDSAHARALETLRADPSSTDACLACHSTDYALAARRNASRALRGLPPDPLPSIDDGQAATDPVEPVGCGSCHSPHGSPFPVQLRAAFTATCATCHTEPAPTPGVVPHAPQANLLAGSGGRAPAAISGNVSDPLVGNPGVHGLLEDLGGCTKCHGVIVHFDAPTNAMPNQTGHLFEIAYSNCTPCHTPAAAAALTTAIQTEITNRLAALRARSGALAGGVLTALTREKLRAADLNLDLVAQDASRGVHNPRYTRDLLDAADDLMDEVENP